MKSDGHLVWHLAHRHAGQLPLPFIKADDVSWHQVHHLLHRLFKWRGWDHT